MMGHEHLTKDFLLAVTSGELSATELIRLLLRHLAELCPQCHEAVGEFLGTTVSMEDAVEDADRVGISAVPPVFWSAVDEERRHRQEELVPRARQQLEVLLAQPPEARMESIRNAATDFRNPVLVELLLDRYWERLARRPEEALHLAQLAREIALRVPVERYGHWLRRDLCLRSRACEANTLRAMGDLKAADGQMTRILTELEQSPEPLLRAEIYSFAASLRKDQRRFDEAAEMLDRALQIYREVNDSAKAAGVLVNRANLMYKQGEADRAIEQIREALSLLDVQEHPRLALGAGHNLATYLCERGDYEMAQAVLDSHADLYRRHSDFYIRLRKLWLEGLIAQGTEEPEEAERRLLEAREGFVRRELGYDAALVNLDLALLYTEQGRSADVRRLAEEMLPIFQSQDVHREAMAALLIFRRAATEETVSAQMLRDLAGYLRQARHDPRLCYELPS